MKYEVLEGGMGLKFCIHNAKSGVSRKTEQRQIFQSIWQSRKIDYYICPYCIYTVVGEEYDILFKDIEELSRVGNKIFLTLVDGKKIEVNKQNFSIKCCEQNCCNPEAIVHEYKPHKERKDS